MIWTAGLCVVCFGICLPLFLYYKKCLRLHLAAAYKTLGTLCAFLPALIAAIRLEPAYWVCAAALLLSDGKSVGAYTAECSDAVLGANDPAQLKELNQIAREKGYSC